MSSSHQRISFMTKKSNVQLFHDALYYHNYCFGQASYKAKFPLGGSGNHLRGGYPRPSQRGYYSNRRLESIPNHKQDQHTDREQQQNTTRIRNRNQLILRFTVTGPQLNNLNTILAIVGIEYGVTQHVTCVGIIWIVVYNVTKLQSPDGRLKQPSIVTPNVGISIIVAGQGSTGKFREQQRRSLGQWIAVTVGIGERVTVNITRSEIHRRLNTERLERSILAGHSMEFAAGSGRVLVLSQHDVVG